MHKIKIVKEIEDDIFGQYLGEYLNDGSRKTISCGGMYGGDISITLMKGDNIIVDTAPIQKKKLNVGEIYIFEGILSIYAKNPLRGAVIACTKTIV